LPGKAIPSAARQKFPRGFCPLPLPLPLPTSEAFGSGSGSGSGNHRWDFWRMALALLRQAPAAVG